MPGRGLGPAEVRIGDSSIMLADHCEESPSRSPTVLDGSSVAIHLYMENVDSGFARTVAAGAISLREPTH